MSSAAALGQKLMVHVIRAEGLQHMNHFTGDHPYVVVEVKHEDSHQRKTTAQTKPVTVGDTQNPFWDEALELEPWNPGEALEFIVYDKGLLGSKTEGKVLLPSEMFYPNGFNGMLNISGLPFAKLQVAVQPFGSMMAVGQPAAVASTGFQAASAGSVTYQTPQVYSAAAPTYSSAAAPMYMTQAAPTYAEAPAVTYAAPATTYTGQVSAPVTYQAPASTYTAGAPVYQAPPTYAPQAVPTSSITYAAPTTTMTQSAASPTYTSSPMTYAAPAPTVTYTGGAASVQAPMTYSAAQPSQPYVVQGAQPGLVGGVATGSTAYAGPQRLAVSILQAHGLQHMNHFTGDHPYVTCEVKHTGHFERKTMVETKPVTKGDVLNPFWGETHHLEPWHMGEALEFTVYDKGLVGSKTEGKIVLPSENFQAQGFSGMLQISGLPHALLHVIVRPMGPSTVGTTAPITEVAEAVVSGKTKSKKLKKNKKSKGCC